MPLVPLMLIWPVMFAGGRAAPFAPPDASADQVVLAGADRSAERLPVGIPAAAGRRRVLQRPAAEVDCGRAAVVQLDVVVLIRGAGVAAAAIELADHDRAVARLRRRRTGVRARRESACPAGRSTCCGRRPRRWGSAGSTASAPLPPPFSLTCGCPAIQQREQSRIVRIVGVVDDGVLQIRRGDGRAVGKVGRVAGEERDGIRAVLQQPDRTGIERSDRRPERRGCRA